MLHYIKVAQPTAARSNALALLQSGASKREIYRLSVESPGSPVTLQRGSRLEGMKEPIARLQKMIEEGYELERADPNEIARAIEKLGGKSLQAIKNAQQRLKTSGEYALPKLVGVLTSDDASDRLRERVINVLPMLGKEAVRGLSCALQSEDPTVVQNIAYALGRIEYPHAAPRLKEVLEREKLLDQTKKYVEAALIRCAGRKALKKSAAELFYDWSLKYYYRAESIRPDPRYDTANVWYWQDGILTYKKVVRPIFTEVYAMRMARMTLKHDPEYYPAVSVWLSAMIKKEADLPAGATDTVRGEDQPGADFYALASSPKFLQSVLARALKDDYVEVAVPAIQALAKTAGARSLVRPVEGGTQPLVQAMTYPSRRVRFLAAWALGNARPDREFRGSQLVVPVLSEAIRQTGEKRALFVATGDQANNLKASVRDAGYEVIDQSNPTKAILAAVDHAGVDVVVLSGNPDPVPFVRSMRKMPILSGTPVVIALNNASTRSLAEEDGRVVILEENGKGMAESISNAIKLGAGEPLTQDEASQWAVRACKSIHGLGLTRNEVYSIDRARPALIDALDADSDDVKVAASEALSVLADASAQRSIVKLAVNPDAGEDVRIKAFQAASNSAKRFGAQVTDDQAAQLVQVVIGDGSQELRVAAAQLQGSLNLPSEKIKNLILTTKGQD
jgi:HEAT repeat protein